MAAIRALRGALAALAGSPVVFLAGLFLSLVVLPQSALQLAGVPLVPFLLQVVTFFVTPFLVAGLVGMADEALDGSTALGTLTRVGRERYVPLLLGNFVQLAIVIVFAIVVGVVAVAVALIVGVGAVTGGGSSAGVGGAAILAGVVLLLLAVVFLVVQFFLQFFAVSIVVGETGAIDGFKRSYRLVRDNIVATLGYSAVTIVASVATAAPVTAFTLARTFQRMDEMGAGPGAGPGAGVPAGPGTGFGGSLFSVPEIAAIALISLALGTLLTTFQQTYATSFYRHHWPGARTPGESEPTATAGSGREDPGESDDEWEFGEFK
jgi:hypothetical protein